VWWELQVNEDITEFYTLSGINEIVDLVLFLFVQIHIDIPRMCPLIPLFQQTAIQQVSLSAELYSA